jgi:heme exporter protein B
VSLKTNFKSLLIILQHEMLVTLRQAHTWLGALLFFVIVVCLFPFALGADSVLLKKAAPGIIWVAALLAILLSIGQLFREDVEEGHLDVVLLSSHSLTVIVFCKICCHWLMNCLPLILMSPLLGFLLQLDTYQEYALIMTLLLGTPALSLLGAIGSALVVGTRGNGLLLPVLIMPLYIPILIFGAGTIIAASTHQPLQGYFAIMGALTLFSLSFGPFFAAMALRIGVNQ